MWYSLAVLSLAWPYLAGAGALPAMLHRARPPHSEVATFQFFAAVWSFGLCLNYLLLLVFGQLSLVIGIGASLAIVMGVSALWQWHERFRRPRRLTSWALAAGLLLACLVAIVLDPLNDWDARSIWFFHGKMIFFSGGLSPATGLGLNIGYADHAEYPMLVPGMAAEIAYVVGFWNEYLPKFALVLLLPVPILAVLSLRNTPRSMLIAIFAFTAIPGSYLLNGSMDGYLAVYAGAAALFLVDWLEGGGDETLLAAAGALGVVGGLKLEGQVLYLALGLSLILLTSFAHARLHWPRYITMALALMPFTGYIAWHVLQHRWALPGEGYKLANAWPRIFKPGALWQIAEGALLDQRVLAASLVLGSVVGFLRLRRRPLRSATWIPLLAGLLYLAGMFAIFAMTGSDLSWQLRTAANRVARSGAILLLIAAVVALREYERSDACVTS
jgi:hypothetical protein